MYRISYRDGISVGSRAPLKVDAESKTRSIPPTYALCLWPGRGSVRLQLYGQSPTRGRDKDSRQSKAGSGQNGFEYASPDKGGVAWAVCRVHYLLRREDIKMVTLSVLSSHRNSLLTASG